MTTSCKSCRNWTPRQGEEGWCANFRRVMVNNTTCGEWRRRESPATPVPRLPTAGEGLTIV